MRLSADIFLGECSLTLTRNIDYEIPFLQRQISKQQQQLVDLERKQAEHLHSAVLAAKAYQKVQKLLIFFTALIFMSDWHDECESASVLPECRSVRA
jgi:hypothetical protein